MWNKKPETASRVRQQIEARLWNWAKVRGYRQAEDQALPAGAGFSTNCSPPGANIRRVEHHPALPYREIGTLMARLRREKSTASARALEFMILTATRTGEALGARWDEIDLEQRMWTLPPRPHEGGARTSRAAFPSHHHHPEGDGRGSAQRIRVPRCQAGALTYTQRILSSDCLELTSPHTASARAFAIGSPRRPPSHVKQPNSRLHMP